MRLSDFFTFKDLARVVLVGSALLFFIGGMYGVFLHAMYTSQVSGVGNDLTYISDMMKAKSSSAYTQHSGTDARTFKEVSTEAADLAKEIKAPSVTPNAYTYFNYWIASAAFTELTLNPKILGLPDETIAAFQELDNGQVLGKKGWWNRQEFYGFDPSSGQYRIFLQSKPKLETQFWSFYIFVFIVSLATIFFTVKEEYEIPIVPEIIYGIFLPSLFFVVYSLASLVSLTGIIRLLDPSQVDVFVLMLSFVIMSVISAAGAMAAALLRSRKKGEE